MSVRRSVNTKLWFDEWIETLSVEEKLLWLYLLTNPQTNMLGIYEISIKRICFESGIKEDAVLNALKGFERVNKCFYILSKYIFLPNWMKHQGMNPNMVKSAMEAYENLDSEIKTYLSSKGLKGFETLRKDLPMLPKGKGREGNLIEGKGIDPSGQPDLNSVFLYFQKEIGGRMAGSQIKQTSEKFYNYIKDWNNWEVAADSWILKERPEKNGIDEPSQRKKSTEV